MRANNEFLLNYGDCKLYAFDPGEADGRYVLVKRAGITINKFLYSVMLESSYSKALSAAFEFIDKKTKTPDMPKQKTIIKEAGFTAPELRFIHVGDIAPDPNQPRKHFDEQTDQELLESIKSNGILQPILLRPNTLTGPEKDGPAADGVLNKIYTAKYLIVCGERRYHSALSIIKSNKDWMAGMVPAQIRSMTDDEALEAQIVENLQRKDVHPMEEALAFQSLAKRGLTQEQIGARLGKGDRFVRARLVLCNLGSAWQELFFRYAIDLETALKICRFSADEQKEIYKDAEITKEDLKDKDFRLELHDLAKYRGDLATACFDKADPTLNPALGACTGCQFNTQTANLFPDDQKARCMNLKCFGIKTDVAFNKLLETAKDDPTIILVKPGYRTEDDKQTAKLRKAGFTILEHGDFAEVDEITIPPATYEEWKKMADDYEGPTCYDYDESEKYNREAYRDEKTEVAQELKEYDENLKSGNIKKALVIQGYYNYPRGRLISIKINTRRKESGSTASAGSVTPAQKVASGKATAIDYSQEIDRLKKDIKDTEGRRQDHVHSQLVTMYKNSPVTVNRLVDKITKVERACLMLLLFDQIGGVEDLWDDCVMFEVDEQNQDILFSRAMGIQIERVAKKKGSEIIIKNAPGSLEEESEREAVFSFVEKLDDFQFALLVRRVIAKHYGQMNYLPSMYTSGKAFILRKMIEVWKGIEGTKDQIDIDTVENECKAKAETRITKAKHRIKAYQDEIKELAAKKARKKKTPPDGVKDLKPHQKKAIKALTKKGTITVDKGIGKAGEAKVQTCKVCGCTQADCRRCIEVTGGPCSWVAADLCSACKLIGEALNWIGYNPEFPWLTVRENLTQWLAKLQPAGKKLKSVRTHVRNSASFEDFTKLPTKYNEFLKLLIAEYRQSKKINEQLDKVLGEVKPVEKTKGRTLVATGKITPEKVNIKLTKNGV